MDSSCLSPNSSVTLGSREALPHLAHSASIPPRRRTLSLASAGADCQQGTRLPTLRLRPPAPGLLLLLSACTCGALTGFPSHCCCTSMAQLRLSPCDLCAGNPTVAVPAAGLTACKLAAGHDLPHWAVQSSSQLPQQALSSFGSPAVPTVSYGLQHQPCVAFYSLP